MDGLKLCPHLSLLQGIPNSEVSDWIHWKGQVWPGNGDAFRNYRMTYSRGSEMNTWLYSFTMANGRRILTTLVRQCLLEVIT